MMHSYTYSTAYTYVCVCIAHLYYRYTYTHLICALTRTHTACLCDCTFIVYVYVCAGILHYSQATHIPPWHSQSSASRMVCGKDKGRGCSDYIYSVFARTHRHAHTWPFVFSSLESKSFSAVFCIFI